MKHHRYLLTLALAFAAPSVAQQRSIYDLSGDGRHHLLGWSVAPAGDVNKDGVPDFIAGAPFDFGVGTGPGSARVYSGATGMPLLTWTGDANKDQFGVSVDGAGDVDADGWPDLVVGAWGHDKSGKSSGQTKVFSGKDGKVLWTHFGKNIDDHFGGSVAGIGDIDKDGHADFVAGAQWADNRGPDSGSVHVISGRTGTTLYRFDGDLPGGWLGYRVAAAGDVNRDGVPDIIAGAPLHVQNGSATGMARVYSGKDGSVLWSFFGDNVGDQFGASVTAAGDIDGDGFDDVLVGMPGFDFAAPDAGGARVFSGKTGSILRTFAGRAAGDAFGFSAGGAGDIDRDGRPDVIIGAPAAQQRTGAAYAYSGRTGQLLASLRGAQKSDELGFAVALLGDVTGNGHAELAVGARYADGAATNEGLLRVLPGGPHPLSSDTHIVPIRGGTQKLSLAAGVGHADKIYALLGSASGPRPGFALGALTVPLNVDPYMLSLLGAPHTLLQPSAGLLDAKGEAAAMFVLPAGLPLSLLGVNLHHAFIAIDTAKSSFDFASNAVPVTLAQ